jgi:hypothetical protein
MSKEEFRRNRAKAASQRMLWARVATVVVALSALLGWAVLALKVL